MSLQRRGGVEKEKEIAMPIMAATTATLMNEFFQKICIVVSRTRL
jgi:hypothetical protein